MGLFMMANADLSDKATSVRIQGGSLGTHNLVKCITGAHEYEPDTGGNRAAMGAQTGKKC